MPVTCGDCVLRYVTYCRCAGKAAAHGRKAAGVAAPRGKSQGAHRGWNPGRVTPVYVAQV
jgi:hypothetical protein